MPDTTYTTARSSVFDDILYQFEKDYRAGKNPEPEAYLTGEADNRWRLLLELLHSNLELRLRAGEKLCVKDYLQKYPELAQCPGDILTLLAVELRFLNEQGQKPVLEKYEQDYGKLIPSSLKPLFVLPSPRQTDHNLGKLIANRYRLIKVLGQGGMGTVYLAEQSEPVKRQVALKLIKTGIDSRQYITRFEAERQALAVMDHPNIARVYDGGTTEQHQPYFVMELVQGTPITQYCDQHRLSLKVRLELFVFICQAVQHAHQKGIIHRDLKPGNVLVTELDGRPVPKVIDFGLAKATEQPLTDETIEEQGIVGTPAYMSPEQADPDNQDVDTRTDIYALGVILYELLTGSTPIEAREFRRGAMMEMLRMVREEEPPRPSTKLSSTEELPSIAANRDLEPKQLLAWVRGDIEWIVMKSLEKDRNRRYETANGLAADVQRYLCGEPVLAHPPSRWYRVKKFVRRNRTQVIAAGFIVTALVVGLGISLWQMNRAIKAEFATAEQLLETRKAQIATEEQLKLTNLARADAMEKLAFSKKSNEILGSVFTGLDPKANYATVADLLNALKTNLNKAVQALDGSAIGDPLTVAQMQSNLGVSLLGLGDAPQSIILLGKAQDTRKAILGLNHRDTIISINDLALSNLIAGQLLNAIKLFEKSLELAKSNLGFDDLNTLKIMHNLAGAYHSNGQLGKALPLFEETFKLFRAKIGLDHPDTIVCLGSLAQAYQATGQLEKALPLLEESVEQSQKRLGNDHPDTISSKSILAECYRTSGQYNKALPLFKELHQLRTVKLGPNHPTTLASVSSLALIYKELEQLDASIMLNEETLKLRKEILGHTHPDTLTSMNNLGSALMVAGKLERAVPLLEETLLLTKDKLGPNHPRTLASMGNLAQSYLAAGQLDKALPLLEDTLKRKKVLLGVDHPDTLTSMNNLGLAYQDAYQFEKAIKLLQDTHKLRRQKLGNDHPQTLATLSNLGTAYCDVKQFTLAEQVLREALTNRERLQPNAYTTFNTMSKLGRSLLGQKKYTEAEQLLLRSYEHMKNCEKLNTKQASIFIPEALDRIIQLYTETHKPDDLKKWQAERAKYPGKLNEIKK